MRPPAPSTTTPTMAPTAAPLDSSYTLAVPDWVSGPSDIAAAVFPARDHPGGQQDDSPNVYAFAVPTDQPGAR